MKKIASYLSIILLACCLLSASGQNCKFYSTDNGLSNSLTNQIYQDHQGFIWIATEYGLNKFDGINFTIYTHHPGDSLTLKSNYVHTLFEDYDHNLFVGTILGLMKYDRASDNFQDIKMWRNGKVVNPHVTSIMQAHDGSIWIATSGQGVFTYDSKKNIGLATNELTNKLPNVYLNLIYQDSHSNIWIGSENDGLTLYCPKDKHIDSFNLQNGKINSNKISAITEDHQGNIFVGTLTQGVNKYDPANKRFNPIPCTEGTQPLLVSTLAIDNLDQLYIGTDGQGLKIYNSSKNTIEECSVNYTLFDFSKGKVHSILQDKDKNLWLGMFQKGVVLIPNSQSSFDYIGYKLLGNNPIGSSCVTAIHKDKEGVIWVGTDNEGIYGIDDKGKRKAHFFQTTQPTSAPDIVHNIHEDANGQLWIGSYAKGLAKLKKHTGQCDYIEALKGEKVYCVTGDIEGNLLIGTYGSGLYIMNPLDGKIENYRSTTNETDNLTADELSNNWVNCILSDTEGLIWIGHYKGVSCFDRKKHTFINFLGKNNLLPGNVVLSLFEDEQHNMWIGTSAGLYVFDKKHKTIKSYTTKNGLANDVICGITQDETGAMWISTYHGISKYDTNKDVFVNFYSDDGLQGNEFSRNAVFKDESGKIFFGGVNGITSFYPNKIADSNKKLNVLITNFYRFNQPIKKGDKSGGNDIVNTSVSDAPTFTLSYQDNTFSFQFSTLQFSIPERISYQYMMESINSNWISTARGMDRVTYNNLAPGKYTFKFRAYDGQNYSPIKSVLIVIMPPWYLTVWAYGAYIALFLFLIYGVVNYILSRIRYRQELTEKEQAEKINEAKLEFFINISHEIRTPMTLIINPLQKLLADKNDTTNHKVYMIMYRNAQRILRLINQLMDMRKIDKGQMNIQCRETDIVGFIEDLMLPFEYLAQSKHIRFIFLHSIQALKVWIDLEQFDKVLLNILSNAFKYTPEGGEITISLSTGESTDSTSLDHYFEICVSDTGIGIDKDKMERIFDRFYQINNDKTKSNFGTGIGLHIAHLFVSLHQGIIFAENRTDGQGSRFVIRLPLGKEHLTKKQMVETDSSQLLSKVTQTNVITSIVENGITHTDNAPKTKTKYRLLIAEDEDEIRKYMQEELSGNYRIITCANGKEALEATLTQKPDLVISDVMMPDMDGITLCRKIKQNININHIPVILLTAKAKPEDKAEGLNIGADAYITKPYDSNILKYTINNLLKNRELLRNKFTGNQEQGEKLEKIKIKAHDEILIERILAVVNDNLSSPSLNVEMIASHVGISRVHLHRKLKEITNQSARDFIKGIRLKQAASLLADKKLGISEVAYAVGFTNLSHFSNSFKEFHGVSPSEYSEHKRSEEECTTQM